MSSVATGILHVINAEHARLWRLLNALEKFELRAGRTGAALDLALYQAIFDYLEAFCVRLHHPREERYLFEALRARERECIGLLDELQAEHAALPGRMARLRELLAGVQRQGRETRPEFHRAVAELVRIKREHIQKEDRVLAPLSRRVLSARDWAAMNAALDADPAFSEALHAELRERYRDVINYAPAPLGLGLDHVLPEDAGMVLAIEQLCCHYGRIQALDSISLEVREGELVALVGANGAGKTTLLRALSGVLPTSSGHIRLRGDDITALRPDQRVRMGVSQVPEGRQVFAPMSVQDNLMLGAYTRSRHESAEDLQRMYRMFPVLEQKRGQAAGLLSGGQQQMLVIARALMARPRLLLLDEPSMGLAPLLVDEIFDAVLALKAQGMTIFLVEQNAYAALAAADHGHVIEAGRIVLSGPGRELLDNERVRAAYLGM